MNLDVLVFAAHPDDAELAMGGTIAKYTAAGLKVGIVDLTRGELGTRGTAETRQKEAFDAGIILKVALRENLSIADCGVEDTKENRTKIMMMIRKYKPKVVYAPYFNDRHPDHMQTSNLVKKSFFFSGLKKMKTAEKDHQQDSYRPEKLYYYMQTYEFAPSFVVDISDYYETKTKAVTAYSTQFWDPKSKEPETFISQPGFLEFLRARAEYFGFKIGKKYGEAFFTEEMLEYDPTTAIKKI